MSEHSETASVGYKRPPRKTQFKPGKSGNPRGRPKRKVDMSSALNQAFNDKIVVTGLGKTLTGMEAFVQSIVDRVLQGESKAIPELVRLFTKTKLFKPVPDPTRLTGVVVMPAAYKRDQELGKLGGFYEVQDGMGLYVDPKTQVVYTYP
jgi:Family of unknown function (DUF5681)